MAKQSRDPSYERLARALFLVHPDKPADGSTPIGAAFGGSPQLANNWPQRGVPIERAVEAQRRWGINAVWVLHGEGEMLIGKSHAERLSDSTMDRTVDILNVLAAARPSDNDLNPVRWATISKAARAVEKSTAIDQRQLFAEVLSCIQEK